jgi:type IV pilus assembly protein PilC
MPHYAYETLSASGEKQSGEIAADAQAAAIRQLEQQGLYVIRIAEAASMPAGKPRRAAQRPVPLKEMAALARQLAIMAQAGVPMTDALGCVREQTPSRGLREALEDVIQDVLEGHSLAWALSRRPRVFPRLFTDMVRAGEMSSELAASLDAAASYLESSLDISQRVRAAVAYPLVLLCISIATVALLITFILPRFMKLFTDMHVAIPWSTRVLLLLADFIRHYWFIGIGCAVGAWFLARLMTMHQTGAETLDRLKLSLPVAGSLIRRVNIARIGMALGTALNGGLPLIEALDTAFHVTQNRALRGALASVKESIMAGSSVADALRQTGQFPALVRQMVAAGERSGHLADMLLRLSGYYSREADAEIKGLTAVLEPVLVVCMGAVVGLIAVSIISPIYSIVGSMK